MLILGHLPKTCTQMKATQINEINKFYFKYKNYGTRFGLAFLRTFVASFETFSDEI